jgi:multidrug resistance efflux pump
MNEGLDNNTRTDSTGIESVKRSEALSLSERVQSLRLPSQQARGSSRGILWLLGVLCCLLALSTGGLGYYALNRPEADASKSSESSPALGDGLSLGTSSGMASLGSVVVESKGYITPVHQIQVSPKVSGMIVKLYFLEGKRVKKDEILAELEKVEYEADRNHAQAALDEAKQGLLELTQHREKEIAQAKARWEEAEVQRKQLELDRRRSNRLRTGNALADRDFEQADSAYLAMLGREKALKVDYDFMIRGPRDNRIEAAKRRIRQLEEDLVKAQWRLDNCTIRAPISGTILTKFAEEGNIVNQLSFNLKGSLCDMADLSDLEVDMSIQEREVARVFQGQRCRIRPEAFSDRVYDGYVSRLMPIADRAKGAVPVRVKVQVPKEEEGVYLKPDMGAVVQFFKKDDKSPTKN